MVTVYAFGACMKLVDDEALLLQFRAGDRTAYRELVRRYQQKVYGIAYGMLHNADDAMDVTQEAFIKVHRHADTFKGSSSFYTWIYRITINACIDHLRRNKRAAAVEFDETIGMDEDEAVDIMPSTSDQNPLRNLERKELRGQIEKALATLSPAHRAVILMREVEGLSYQEIADITEISIGTVMSRLFHARRRMQAALLSVMGGEIPVPRGTLRTATASDEP